jgi:hypothetical protein
VTGEIVGFNPISGIDGGGGGNPHYWGVSESSLLWAKTCDHFS